jgi:hypothetical protein
MDYRMIGRSDGKFAGGVLHLSADMQQHGAKPLWIPYLSTPTSTRSSLPSPPKEGRSRCRRPTSVGRIAMVTDPQGVPST